MRKLEKLLKAFANARRLAILKFLSKEKEAHVSAISREIGLSFKSTSRHLAVLYAVDLLAKEQRDVEVFYRLKEEAKPSIKTILNIPTS
ncbi:MAG: transcriptional regulator [Candidatus Harrisonbacteria bacterium CG10_big_fil_rev_8_21_14_0_10_49_15]|uniref:Transcriptional regulator n=1 Tax=Candidatus Harrisonbacteria bacterium CG10_big_fil_rev_8_21_14_0_10_49_15 TaxID=1974587 RepID=A0A2H0UKJ9_9BACT|nr:MAG: transcriptional regulator [Candidatus Harrisonbacteria bacterium CG10_big_fil_rev_8_21_14_0_10_49_15]